MEGYEIVGKLQEIIQDVKQAKDEYEGKGREWAVAHTKLQDALAWIKTYCVEDEDEN